VKKGMSQSLIIIAHTYIRQDDIDDHSDAKLRYARSIMQRPQTSSKAGLEMKRTLKAAKIQRDVVS